MIFQEFCGGRLVDEWSGKLHIGISNIGSALSNVHTCYTQASQVVTATQDRGYNSVYTYGELAEDLRNTLFGLDLQQKLYQLVLSGENEKLEEAFEQLLSKVRKRPLIREEARKQVFYSLRHTLACAFAQIAKAGDEIGEPAYRDMDSMECLLVSLEQMALEICNYIEMKKKSRNEDLKRRIITFLEGHYQDSGLTAGILCAEVGISEKYLFQFIKEHTGKSFAVHLEDLRMDRARLLLLNTTLSNADIAEKTGFGTASTFYRVFQKRQGVSPGAYRRSHG